MRKNNYTLIELMVTISIIGVLLTMLLSAMKVGKDKIKDMQCLDNLKAHGAAIAMYASDNQNELVPPHLGYQQSLNPKSIYISSDDLLSHYMGRGLSQESMEAPSLRVDQDDKPWTNPDVSDEVIQCPFDEVSRDGMRNRTYVMNGRDVLFEPGAIRHYDRNEPKYGEYGPAVAGSSDNPIRPFKFSRFPDLSGTIAVTERSSTMTIAGYAGMGKPI